MGMPITGYIRIRKLQYALGSLLEGRKVLDVSLMYAFDSHEGFTRSFTQLFGSTPSKVKKYLTSYKVPEYCVPNIEGRRMRMGADKESLIDNMHQIVYEVLKTSLEEADAGFCTEINITLYEDGRVKITDNGRGIPLSQNEKTNHAAIGLYGRFAECLFVEHAYRKRSICPCCQKRITGAGNTAGNDRPVHQRLVILPKVACR